MENIQFRSSQLTPSVGTLAENFDQRYRKIACRQKTELSKEIEETVSILTGKNLKRLSQDGSTLFEIIL